MRKLANRIQQLTVVMIVTMGCYSFLFAETPQKYQDDLARTKTTLENLNNYYLDAIEIEEIDEQVEISLLNELESSFVIDRKVEFNGYQIDVSNKWFAERLEQLKTSNDIENDQLIANEVYERITAIEKALDELIKATESEISKDERKLKATEILNRPEFAAPKPEDKSIAQIWWEKLVKWWQNLFQGQEKPNSPKMSGMPNLAFLLQALLFALIIGGLIFLAIKFLPKFFPELRRKKKAKKERFILGEEIGEDVSSYDIFSEAESLARSGDLRMAIRKGYIAMLCDLDDRHIIGLAKHKTNRDYLRDIKKQRELHKTLYGMTGMFEHTWYGERKAEESDWEEFRNGYNTAVKAESN